MYSNFRVANTNVTFPVEVTNKAVKEKLNEKIKSGVYSIGEKIVPQVFECMKLKDGKIQVEQITVCGK